MKRAHAVFIEDEVAWLWREEVGHGVAPRADDAVGFAASLVPTQEVMKMHGRLILAVRQVARTSVRDHCAYAPCFTEKLIDARDCPLDRVLRRGVLVEDLATEMG
jgi:hypothetical protein